MCLFLRIARERTDDWRVGVGLLGKMGWDGKLQGEGELGKVCDLKGNIGRRGVGCTLPTACLRNCGYMWRRISY